MSQIETIHTSGFSYEKEVLSERALGFWLYLMSDAIIFAVLFANYGIQAHGYADGPKPYEVFELKRAAIETALLLTSSMTFGFASISANEGKRSMSLLFLAITFALGASFIGLELSEFSGMIAHGAGPQRSGFLSAFFGLVGTHGLHVSIGLLMVLVMMAQIAFKGLTDIVLSRLYRVGLFWHFLDIIWIGIFSFVYLPGVMK